VLRMRVPAEVAALMKPAETAAPVEPAADGSGDAGSDDEDGLPWPWLVGGGLVFVVGAGWLLVRRGQAS